MRTSDGAEGRELGVLGLSFEKQSLLKGRVRGFE